MILSLCVRCKYRIKFAALKNVENMKLKELTLKENDKIILQLGKGFLIGKSIVLLSVLLYRLTKVYF